jgi:sigma-70-like protein
MQPKVSTSRFGATPQPNLGLRVKPTEGDLRPTALQRTKTEILSRRSEKASADFAFVKFLPPSPSGGAYRLAGAPPHGRRLFRLARRLSSDREEARDLVQEAFLHAARQPSAVQEGGKAGGGLTCTHSGQPLPRPLLPNRCLVLVEPCLKIFGLWTAAWQPAP